MQDRIALEDLTSRVLPHFRASYFLVEVNDRATRYSVYSLSPCTNLPLDLFNS